MNNKHLINSKSIAFFILLFVSAGATKSFSQTTFNKGNLKYAIFENISKDNGALVLVTGFADKEHYQKELIIPNLIIHNGETYYVNAIMPYAFNGCSDLVSVNLPNTIASIGDGTFFNCTGLLSVVIPDTVSSIGKYAFYGCKSLTAISVPKAVKIHEEAFKGCAGLIINKTL